MDRTVLLVDCHPVVREGLRCLLEKQEGLSICGEAGDVPGALPLIEEHRPDLVVLDLGLTDGRGFDLIRAIRRRWPQIRVLVFSRLCEKAYAERLLHAGASGFVMKATAPEKVIEAIWAVLGGVIFVSDEVCAAVLRRMRQGACARSVAELSDREVDVLRMIGQGSTRQHIADTLEISAKTVDSHCAHIKDKLALRNGRELLQRAIEWVLFSAQATPQVRPTRSVSKAASSLANRSDTRRKSSTNSKSI